MKRLLMVAIAMVGMAGLAACDKPSVEDCKLAITNMQKLLGTDQAAKNADNDGEIRRCKGGSKREAVACAIKATTLDELKACEFMGKAKK